MPQPYRILKVSGTMLIFVVLAAVTLWASAALYFDFPIERLRLPLSILYLAAVSLALFWYRGRGTGVAMGFAAFALAVAWWLSLKPSNFRTWQPDVAETAWAEINGDTVIIHNFRNCDYRAEFDYTPHWETRSYDLRKLRGIDVFFTYWGSPWIAHPIVSFDFGDQGYVALSIETRKEVGETYSAFRGFFRYYELIYTISDERDVVRLRTNYRHGEEVYLFHTKATVEQAHVIFLDYLARANRMHEHAEWYNALTNNCSTNIAPYIAQAQHERVPLDYRLVLNGRADELLYERGDIETAGLPFSTLKEKAHINAVARTANDSPEFSSLIRRNRPGFPAN